MSKPQSAPAVVTTPVETKKVRVSTRIKAGARNNYI